MVASHGLSRYEMRLLNKHYVGDLLKSVAQTLCEKVGDNPSWSVKEWLPCGVIFEMVSAAVTP